MNINQHLEDNGVIASDLKLIMMTLGLQTCSCYHPCAYCDASHNNLEVCGTYRTVDGCTKDFETWQLKTDSNKNLAKHFNNCINKPLLPAGNKRILFCIPPPELHLLLGAVNTVFDNMLVEHKQVALDWVKKCSVTRKITHGNRYSFVGNDCKKLLRSTDVLASMRCFGIEKYVDYFRKLNKVVDSCFSKDLHPNYEEYIQNLKVSFMDLDIAITPKLHIIFEHVAEYCKCTNKGTNIF